MQVTRIMITMIMVRIFKMKPITEISQSSFLNSIRLKRTKSKSHQRKMPTSLSRKTNMKMILKMKGKIAKE
jgi:hypothetical protein